MPLVRNQEPKRGSYMTFRSFYCCLRMTSVLKTLSMCVSVGHLLERNVIVVFALNLNYIHKYFPYKRI